MHVRACRDASTPVPSGTRPICSLPHYCIVLAVTSLACEAFTFMMAKILVADDATLLRVLACRSLEGHQTIEASDGEQALALVREHHPHIAILDWMMPGLSGVDVCRAIREDPDLAGIQ